MIRFHFIEKILILLTAILLNSSQPVFTSNTEKIIRRYYTDPLVLKRVYQCIKASHLNELKGFDNFSLKGDTFMLFNNKKKSVVIFKSKHLRGFSEKLRGQSIFSEILLNAKAYGIDIGKKSFKTKDGSTEILQSYDARVLIMFYGEGADEEDLVFLADR